jgi:hypothetical protein
MRRGLSEFLTAKVEELRLEGEEGVPASEQSQELDAVLGSAVEERGSPPEPTLHERAEIRARGEHGSSSRSPDGLP